MLRYLGSTPEGKDEIQENLINGQIVPCSSHTIKVIKHSTTVFNLEDGTPPVRCGYFEDAGHYSMNIRSCHCRAFYCL